MNIEKLKEQMIKIESLQPVLESVVEAHSEIIILGNGGSNSIASHISQDYTKALKKRSFTFSDPSRLTCYINDYGMENAYVEFLKEFSKKETLVILISSSGESDNIINSADFCNKNNIKLVTLSGFKRENRLNSFKSEANYWVDSEDYGIIECAHMVFLHSII
tara:strand:+ start:228 stop:716 length:489 start_codon:yes stop_codon:yes gene_type:complete